MPTPDPQSRSDRAASFSSAADVYARVRPTYPAEIVDWMVPPGAQRVLDLAAGTGLLTTRLVDRGLQVVAVDVSEAMLQELAARLPDVETHVGTAEEIPLPDASVDAVVVGQAWHWFSPGHAAAEIARVLRPGGTLGVVRNDRDQSIDWVSRFGAILHDGDLLDEELQPGRDVPELGEPYTETESVEQDWQHLLEPQELRELAASRSYVITLPAEDREQLLQRVDDLVVTHPDLAGSSEIAMPYVAVAYRARRR